MTDRSALRFFSEGSRHLAQNRPGRADQCRVVDDVGAGQAVDLEAGVVAQASDDPVDLGRQAQRMWVGYHQAVQAGEAPNLGDFGGSRRRRRPRFQPGTLAVPSLDRRPIEDRNLGQVGVLERQVVHGPARDPERPAVGPVQHVVGLDDLGRGQNSIHPTHDKRAQGQDVRFGGEGPPVAVDAVVVQLQFGDDPRVVEEVGGFAPDELGQLGHGFALVQLAQTLASPAQQFARLVAQFDQPNVQSDALQHRPNGTARVVGPALGLRGVVEDRQAFAHQTQ